ncbi:MAG: bifunctional folylpolyglutamate synthase/dihydrofolate synthase, partial [Desulfobacterales bacterium]|nr:bifunctional folylpolyglutamate synthase/dihydrofolate synthase [Desulfobacterales bacterium]
MTRENAYDDCLKSMYGLRRFGIKLGLGTIRGVLEGLGNPHEKFSCIHIAGSNGKGSIASTLAAILETSGRRVGLYTSPHLVRFNERIRVNGEPVSNADVVNAHQAVDDVRPRGGARHPTFFEFATAMAFYEFARRKVDWAVVETGMGGRLDATNVITPAVSVISNISMEHRMYLGNTLAEIASEKGGIIKKGVPVVTGVRQRAV